MRNEVPSFEQFLNNARSFQKTEQQFRESIGYTPDAFRVFSASSQEAFSDLVGSGNYDDILGKFRFAYEFRRQDRSFLEGRKAQTEQDILVKGIDKSLQHISYPQYHLTSEKDTIDPDTAFKLSLLKAFPDVIESNRGILSLASKVTESGTAIDQVEPGKIQELMIEGIERYWDRTPVHTIVQFRKR